MHQMRTKDYVLFQTLLREVWSTNIMQLETIGSYTSLLGKEHPKITRKNRMFLFYIYGVLQKHVYSIFYSKGLREVCVIKSAVKRQWHMIEIVPIGVGSNYVFIFFKKMLNHLVLGVVLD